MLRLNFLQWTKWSFANQDVDELYFQINLLLTKDESDKELLDLVIPASEVCSWSVKEENPILIDDVVAEMFFSAVTVVAATEFAFVVLMFTCCQFQESDFMVVMIDW